MEERPANERTVYLWKGTFATVPLHICFIFATMKYSLHKLSVKVWKKKVLTLQHHNVYCKRILMRC